MKNPCREWESVPFAAESESDLLHVLLLFAGAGCWGSHDGCIDVRSCCGFCFVVAAMEIADGCGVVGEDEDRSRGAIRMYCLWEILGLFTRLSKETERDWL